MLIKLQKKQLIGLDQLWTKIISKEKKLNIGIYSKANENICKKMNSFVVCVKQGFLLLNRYLFLPWGFFLLHRNDDRRVQNKDTKQLYRNYQNFRRSAQDLRRCTSDTDWPVCTQGCPVKTYRNNECIFVDLGSSLPWHRRYVFGHRSRGRTEIKFMHVAQPSHHLLGGRHEPVHLSLLHCEVSNNRSWPRYGLCRLCSEPLRHWDRPLLTIADEIKKEDISIGRWCRKRMSFTFTSSQNGLISWKFGGWWSSNG